MKLQPLFSYVAIERDAAASKSDGGILIPETAKGKPQRGIVVSVGPGSYQSGILVKPSVKTGDQVFFGYGAGREVDADGKKLLVMDESDILAVLK
jgi:chaperonin GroES